MLENFSNLISTGLFPTVSKILLVLIPILMPFALLFLFWVLRLRYIQMKYISEQKPCLLEIKLPKELVKSPAGMEIFFSYLNPGGAGNWGEAFIDGKTRPWFSCELVSIEGEVKFFIWMSENKFKNIIENQLYAEYPNIEIYEIEPENDYVRNFDNVEETAMMGAQLTLTEADVYPIKTYIDYGLTGNEKEEYKIDPITHAIEFLGSIRAGENVWIQIMFRKFEKEGWKHGIWKGTKDLKAEVKKEIEKIRKEAMPKDADKDKAVIKFPQQTKGQELRIAALERSADKVAYDSVVRMVYIAKKDAFNKANIGGMLGSFKQYGSNSLNGFKPKFTTDISNNQKDLRRILPFLKGYYDGKIDKYKKSILNGYKLRSFFEWPYRYYKMKPFILTTEELATIFHFPGNIVSQTPTLRRVPSKKSEAPSNLPI